MALDVDIRRQDLSAEAAACRRSHRWRVGLCLLVFGHPAFAQHARGLPTPDIAQIASRWRDPPSEFGPQPAFGFGMAPSDADVGAALDRLKSLGFRAVTTGWGRKLPYPYLSADYFSFFKRFVAAAKQRDMRIWIVDEAGYPSGFAGGLIGETAPELRMKALVRAGDWIVSGGQSLDEPASADLVAVGALDPVSGESRPIAVRDGRIRWRAPAGRDWHVIAVAHAFRTSPTKSDTNPSGRKDISQSLHDYLDPAATARYIALTHEAYRAAVGDEFGKTILGFRGDEPDFSIKGLPWTDAFFGEFRQLKGYDPAPFLPALVSDETVRLTEQQKLVRADYFDVFSRLFANTFFKMQSDWCARYGLQYQVHLNHEERQIDLGRSEGDFFRDLKTVQSPGVDAIWHQISTDTVSDFPRFASSVAHINGRPQAMSESFAAFRPEATLPIVRYVIDEQLARGINLFEFMYMIAGRPTYRFFDEPGFPALAAYTRRASYLMSMGRPDAHVAVLQSRGTLWTMDAAADDMLVATERMLSEMQIDFDLVDEDAIGKDLTAEAGQFATASGNRYRTVIVPMPDLVPQEVVGRLRTFASRGGKVLFLGRTPPRIVGKNYREARPARTGEFAWAAFDSTYLMAVPTPPAQPPAAPPPLQDVPVQLVAAVRNAVGQEDLAVDRPVKGLRYTHRQFGDATLFFVFNEAGTPLTAKATLKGRGRRAEIWDPSSGSIKPVPGKTSGGGTTVPLELPPYTSQILVLR